MTIIPMRNCNLLIHSDRAYLESINRTDLIGKHITQPSSTDANPAPYFTWRLQLSYVNEPGVDYSAGDGCPHIRKFLIESMGGGITALKDCSLDIQKKVRRMIQEVSNILLIDKDPHCIAVVNQGPTVCGKTKWSKTKEALLKDVHHGDEKKEHLLYSTVSLGELDKEFYKATMQNKWINFVNDQDSKTPLNQDFFRSLDAPTTGNTKFGRIGPISTTAKWDISVNNTPRTKAEMQDQDYRRFFINEWTRSVLNFPEEPYGWSLTSGNIKDPHILDKLTTPNELAGLWRWALAELPSLLAEGFCLKQTVEETKRLWMEHRISLDDFFLEYIEEGKGGNLVASDLFTYVQRYCAEHAIIEVPKQRDLTSLVNKRYPSGGYQEKNVGPKHTSGWTNLRISPEKVKEKGNAKWPEHELRFQLETKAPGKDDTGQWLMEKRVSDGDGGELVMYWHEEIGGWRKEPVDLAAEREWLAAAAALVAKELSAGKQTKVNEYYKSRLDSADKGVGTNKSTRTSLKPSDAVAD